MPYASRRQQRWAHATNQPFARRWDKETPDFAALPEKKDDAGPMAHGPGGLLGTPGIRSQRRARHAIGITTKPMTRSEAARVAALARWGKYTPKKGQPTKGRKPTKTEAERQAAQQAKRDQRTQEREQARETARSQVYERMGIAPDGRQALESLRRGEQPDPAAIARGGFVDAGLVEQAEDGSYRMTPAGRALTSAADSGDTGRAGDTISSSRDRLSARRARQAEQAKKRQARAAKPAGGGGKKKKPPKPPSDASQQRIAQARQRIAEAARRARKRKARHAPKRGRIVQTTKSFTVYKDATGAHRWLARSTTAYRDRDREILPIAALDADSQRMTAAKQFGPLRWWHVGRPDPLNRQAPWGWGLDIGDCDFSTQIGTTRVESGTFRDPAVAQRIAKSADQYELSPGFFHTYGPSGPPDGIYRAVRTFERSLVPTRYGRASNLFTGLTVKEHRMDPNEMERRFKAAIESLGLSHDQAQALAAGLVATDKSAADQGIAFKSDDAPQVFTAPDGTQGIIHDGRFVALKAMPPEFAAADEEKDDGVIDQEGAPADDMVEMMDDQAFIGAIADAVAAKIAPMFGDMKMSEFKTLLGGMATKEAGTQAEIAQLKARLAQLEGHQPAVITNEALAALKSTGPQAPPDGTEPQIPADATPIQRLAAQTMPALYSNAPGGQFAGWHPLQPIPPQQS